MKKAFHETIAERLSRARATGNTAVIRELLGVLNESEIPVEAAHKLAHDLQTLPERLREAREPVVATFADEVLLDLHDRVEEFA